MHYFYYLENKADRIARAACAGNPEAQLKLAVLYYLGDGVE